MRIKSMADRSLSRPEEKSALTMVLWSGIVQTVGFVAGVVLFFYFYFTVFVTAAVSVILAIGLVGNVLLTMGIREFRKVDRSKFNTPWRFMLLLVVGTVATMVSMIPSLGEYPNTIFRPETPSATFSTVFLSAIPPITIAAGFSLVVIGGVGSYLLVSSVAVGLIGEILGLWRVGSRYNETTIEIGAIFVFFPSLFSILIFIFNPLVLIIFFFLPFLSIAAPILVLIGAHKVRGRLVKPM